MDATHLLAGLARSSFPRSAAYDPVWLLDNMMGPCSVWLTEALALQLTLAPGSRVVDLGCGKAMSSIFLAREFGVQVTAVDLWVGAQDNQQRINAAGLTDLVRPVHADAKSLELSPASFDAVVSIDAFHYFAGEPGGVEALTRLVRPGGQIGIVVPGLRDDNGWPDHLAAHWQDGFSTFHGPAWWETLLSREQTIRVDRVTTVRWGGSDDWICWADTCDEWARFNGREPYELEAQMLRDDAAGSLLFVMVTATKL